MTNNSVQPSAISRQQAQDALAYACKVGRYQAGLEDQHPCCLSVWPQNLPPISAPASPITMEEIQLHAVNQAIAKTGSKRAAARQLNISRNTVYGILERAGVPNKVSAKIVKFAAVACILLLEGCAVKRTTINHQPSPIAQSIERAMARRTLSAVVAPPPRTNGQFYVGYILPPDAAAKGLIFYVAPIPGVFSRLTTCGLYDNATLRGLDDTINYQAYVTATNAAGVESLPSNMITFTPQTNSGTFNPSSVNHTLRIGWSNSVSGIVERTPKLNPPTWTAATGIIRTNPVVVTNTAQAYFRLNGVTRATLCIAAYQNLIAFSGPGVLQREVDASTGSYANVLTNQTAGRVETLQPAADKFRVKQQ